MRSPGPSRLTWKGPLGLMGTCACCHTLPLLPLRDQACVSSAPLFRDRTRRLREPVVGVRRGGSEGAPSPFPIHQAQLPTTAHSTVPAGQDILPIADWLSVLLSQRGPQHGKERGQQQGSRASTYQDDWQILFHFFLSFLISSFPPHTHSLTHTNTPTHSTLPPSRQGSCPRTLGLISEHRAGFPKHVMHTLGGT